MFQAIISIHIPNEFIQPIVSVMKQTCPKEICSIFADTPPLNLSFKIQVSTNQNSSKLDNICEAPHLFIYFFTCNDKNDFIKKNEKNNYLSFFKNNKRDYISVVPIYINNSKNTKGKPKIFLQNSFISFLQSEIPNLQTIDIKAKGFASRSGFERLWPSLIGQVVQAVTTRINTIRSLIQKQQFSLDTFRHIIRLYIIYDQVSCFDKCFEVIDNAEKLIIKNRKTLEFIDPKSLMYRFDFCVGADNVEAKIFTENPTEYDLRFVFLKRRIQYLLCLGRNDEAITSAFNFFISVSDCIKKTAGISDYIYCMWAAQALGDIVTQCAKEKEMNKSIVITKYASILEWYVRALPEARNSYKERSRRMSFIEDVLVKDPLRKIDESERIKIDEKTGKVGDFMILENILEKRERFNSEVSRNLESLISFYSGAGLTRCCAVAMSKMAYFEADTDEHYMISAMLTMIKKGYSHLLPIITESILLKIPFEERTFACCKIISDKQSKYREVAVKFLSDILTKSEANQTFRTSFNLPIKFLIYDKKNLVESGSESEDLENNDNENNDNNENNDKVTSLDQTTLSFIQGEHVTMNLKVKCGFSGHLKCNRLLVGFLNCAAVKISYLECLNADIYDGATITVSNSFAKAGSYTIYNLKMMCGQDQVLNVILPSSCEFIHVDPPPLPFDFSIEVPDFLLPRRYSLARLNITIIRDVEQISFKVFGGISYRPANLVLKNGEKRQPENGFTYTNIPSGTHVVNMHIIPQANSSGTLKIEATANNQTITHEARFKVSEFLECKLQFRKATKIAQLSAFIKSNADLIITSADFFEKESSDKIKSKTIGLPLNVGTSPSSALFALEGEPDFAKVLIQQNGIPVTLRLNVETFDEDSMKKMENDDLIELSPLTILCPIDFSL